MILSVAALSACVSTTEQPENSSSNQQSSSSSSAPVNTTQTLPANHQALVYGGRIENPGSERPLLIWQGSRVEIHYRGMVDSVTLAQTTGEVYFDVEVDGQTKGFFQAQNGTIDLQRYQNQSSTQSVHQLSLIKRSESAVGHAGIEQFTLTGQIEAPSTDPQSAPKLLFFGDSITAGACSEDGAQDQWEDRSTHNALVSYAAVTAEHFGAEYQNISVSGVGISTGYFELPAADVWNRYYPTSSSPVADLSSFNPDVIFLNYGENDDAYTSSQNQPFPSDYQSRYLDLLSQVRQQFPSSAIVILRGGMWGGANSDRLRGPWQQVVQQFTGQDSNAYQYVFNHWSSTHPRTSDHQQMAQELISFIQQNNLLD